MQPSSPSLRIPFAELFASEHRQIQELGCKLEMKSESSALGIGTVYARITPVTRKARRALREAAAADGAAGRDAVEVRQTFSDASETLDAIREAIRLALDIAKAALA